MADWLTGADRGNFGIFESYAVEEEVFGWYYKEHNLFGNQKAIEYAHKIRYGNTVVMQRSGSKRLFDQNILLGELFDGRLVHKKYGNLKSIFDGAVFVDIGSGILYGNGAPTVRDIFDDYRVWTHLSYIIATDINGPDCRYIDTYLIGKGNLPFPVRMIGMKLIWKRHFQSLTKGLLKNETSLIFRSANAGPDLYYPSHVLIDHFRAILGEYSGRYVLYLYNKFVLFKPEDKDYFQKIGEIDFSVGMSHTYKIWEKINWEKRRLEDFFYPNTAVLTIK